MVERRFTKKELQFIAETMLKHVENNDAAIINDASCDPEKRRKAIKKLKKTFKAMRKGDDSAIDYDNITAEDIEQVRREMGS